MAPQTLPRESAEVEAEGGPAPSGPRGSGPAGVTLPAHAHPDTQTSRSESAAFQHTQGQAHALQTATDETSTESLLIITVRVSLYPTLTWPLKRVVTLYTYSLRDHVHSMDHAHLIRGHCFYTDLTDQETEAVSEHTYADVPHKQGRSDAKARHWKHIPSRQDNLHGAQKQGCREQSTEI